MAVARRRLRRGSNCRLPIHPNVRPCSLRPRSRGRSRPRQITKPTVARAARVLRVDPTFALAAVGQVVPRAGARAAAAVRGSMEAFLMAPVVQAAIMVGVTVALKALR